AGAGYVSADEPASVVERSDVQSPSKRRDHDPIRVLFVCTANICRSPYLELRARQLLGPDSGVEVASAGTHGFDAEPVSDTMAAEFARWGTDASLFRSRIVTGGMIDEAD